MRTAGLLAALALTACSSSLDGSSPGSRAGGADAAPAPAGDNAPGCPSLLANVTAVTPTIMLLVDRSGTMNRDFGSDSRWDAIYQTLMNGSSGLVRQLEGKVSFGLALYSGQDANPTCPIVNQVAPSLHNFDAINKEFSSKSPLEDTPTGESLDLLTTYLSALPSTGPKAIVVATDGEPDTCAAPDPDGQPAAKAMAVAAAARAFDAGIKTFIISVGNEVSDEHLQDMANAGVGLPANGPQNAPFYKALSTADLQAAFDQVVAGVRGCSFQLDEPASDASTGVVTLDGRPLEQGVDWNLTDSTTIELVGAACDEVLTGGEHEVEAVFECGGDTIVE